MSKFLIANKIGMSRIFREDGVVVSVTKLKAGPCVVTQVKTKDKDGYEAVQLSSGKKRNLKKPLLGHLKTSGAESRFLREFYINGGEYKIGQTIDISQFTPGDLVKVIGISKGKGFQGVVRRHGFHGHPSTHGHKDQERMPGSIGAGGVQHVRKGMRMAGRMGGDRITVPNLKVVAVDIEKNELLVKGAVPGGRNSLLLISAN
jgi:large subunit ribosomal protein L3